MTRPSRACRFTRSQAFVVVIRCETGRQQRFYQFEILRVLLDAKSTDEIASAFNLSPKTVANYHYEIKSKLGVRSDIELVYLCMRQGLVASLAAPGGAA
jgi:DNA-binding CsgD family transcriptional regulator